MSNILVIGDSDLSKALIEALKKNYAGEVINSSRNEPTTKAQTPEQYWGMGKPKPDNQWRGGSRGKGGKTKWIRR